MNIQSKTTKGDVLFSFVSGSLNAKHSKVAKRLMCSIYCNSKFTRTPIKMIGAFTINTTRFANLGDKCSLKSSSMKVSENHWDPAVISKNWDHWFLILTRNRKGDHPFWCTTNFRRKLASTFNGKRKGNYLTLRYCHVRKFPGVTLSDFFLGVNSCISKTHTNNHSSTWVAGAPAQAVLTQEVE